MDLALWALEHDLPAAELARALDMAPKAAQAVYDDIANKRRGTRYLHMAPVLLTDETTDTRA
jgi:NAD+ synthase